MHKHSARPGFIRENAYSVARINVTGAADTLRLLSSYLFQNRFVKRSCSEFLRANFAWKNGYRTSKATHRRKKRIFETWNEKEFYKRTIYLPCVEKNIVFALSRTIVSRFNFEFSSFSYESSPNSHSSQLFRVRVEMSRSFAFLFTKFTEYFDRISVVKFPSEEVGHRVGIRKCREEGKYGSHARVFTFRNSNGIFVNFWNASINRSSKYTEVSQSLKRAKIFGTIFYLFFFCFSLIISSLDYSPDELSQRCNRSCIIGNRENYQFRVAITFLIIYVRRTAIVQLSFVFRQNVPVRFSRYILYG